MNRAIRRQRGRCAALGAVLAGVGLTFLVGCPGSLPGDGEGAGTLRGIVTNDATGVALAGATVSLEPAVDGAEIATDADGGYAQSVPFGVYAVTIARENFASTTRTIAVSSGQTVTLNAALTPTAAVALSTMVEGTPAPGATVTARVNVEVLDGTTTVQGYSWSQSNSVEVTLANATSAAASVTLPNAMAYKDELVHVLSEPPVTADQLPPNVPLPAGEFPGGFPNRFHIMGINPLALEEAGLVTLTVEVETSAGTFEQEVDVPATLPWKWAPGLHNVGLDIPVLLAGKEQDTYNWSLTPPAGSSAALTDGTTRHPYFTPDVSGKYALTVTDETGDAPAQVTMDIYAGEWQGVITGQNAAGRPLAANCTTCHNDVIARDRFTPWMETGHAEIFTDNIETSDHYSESCLACHMVGFDKTADNGGADEAVDYQAFVDANLFHEVGSDVWETVLSDFPATAQMANIQCENCHGPNNGGAHMMGAPRYSMSSDVCGVCHGEPLRHGRFQQWQLSGHANYELAVDEGENGSCARCHTVNGFLVWLPVLLDDDPATDPLDDVEVTWTADESHPQTCVTCHDPHDIGTVSGDGTNAPVRITDDTPPLIAGFTAIGVGKGALCMTCHNSRRGLQNDTLYDTNVAGTSETSRAPHGSAQADVLMGENAYFVEVGVRGPHSFVSNTCVNCHMQATPPPDALSYDQSGTNHTFFASADICAECHGEVLTADAIQTAYDATSATLKGLVEDAMLDLITAQIALGNSVALGDGATVSSAAQITDIEFGESHGRQAITVTLMGGVTVSDVTLNSVEVLDSTDMSLGALYDFADERLVKAGWNLILASNDGSKSVHNPPFVFEFLDAGIDALNELAAE